MKQSVVLRIRGRQSYDGQEPDVIELVTEGTMELVGNYDVTPDSDEYYAYSCITVLTQGKEAGDLALFWESSGSAASCTIEYEVIKIEAVVPAMSEPVEVELTVGETKTFEDPDGYYVGADTSALNPDVATAQITGTVTKSARKGDQAVTAFENGTQYILVNTRAGKTMTNAATSSAAAAGAGTGLSLNGTKDKGDQFGFMEPEFWGGSIPFSVSGNPTFISRDEDGYPTVVLHEGDRANQLANAMGTLFNNDSASVALTTDADLLTAFTQDECLIVGYQRLGSLENAILRQMEGDAAVLPYPMLFASDKKYTTSAHDTTEMGAILATSTDLAFISTVVEVLNRETARVLIPVYYKECLQVQCVDDEKAAAIIDIIHDNFDNSFILAYNLPLGSVMLQSFSEAMQNKREFSAVYAGRQKSVDRALQNKIRTFEKKNGIS